MNVKESHIVTGMSRDSSVSRHNPNLVYDAHNIRITTRDGNNSLLSVTNEKGTKQVATTGDAINGTPLGSAVLNDCIVIFTHTVVTRAEGETEEHYQERIAVCDHIYKCTITSTDATVTTIFEGNANFQLKHPIETLPVFETEEIQKVYWVDGINQPRMINIIRSTAETDADRLNFSREVILTHDPISVEKFSGGGLFPTGTIQYTFSYYDINGQETRLIDISPMFYLSPQEKGATADSKVACSFSITLNKLDTTFSFVRIYSIVRTIENGTPIARCLGDFPCKTKITVTDDGIIGRTIDATSLYFIGGEECIAGTIAQKDNTLFLGDIELTRPNLIDIQYDSTRKLSDIQGTQTLGSVANNIAHNYNAAGGLPHTYQNYYDYSIDNNRSSYYIKRFKYGETYRLGFIAQYKNGQWSDPLWLKDDSIQNRPSVAANSYSTNRFKATITADVVNALYHAGYRRIAPVVVYPQPHERKIIAQGIISPAVYNVRDRKENAPYAQSSWFFRYGNYAQNNTEIARNDSYAGEIQSIDVYAGNESKYKVDGKIFSFHSPDIECASDKSALDLHGLSLVQVGTVSSNNKILEKYVTTETVGINTEKSHVVHFSLANINSRIPLNDYFINSYPMYCDSLIHNGATDTVQGILDYLLGWVVYPWHRQGSLNNQRPLTTAQKQAGFNTRTAMLKRNITVNYYFTKSNYNTGNTYTLNGNPVLFDADQLSAVRVNSHIYYGNIDKVIVPSGSKALYNVRHGWYYKLSGSDDGVNSERKTEDAIANGYNGVYDPDDPEWWHAQLSNGGDVYGTNYVVVSDPVSMKYKSTPHIVLETSNLIAGAGDVGTPTLRLMELQKNNYTFQSTSDINKFNLQWIRCGDSSVLTPNVSCDIDYMQGDCYVQRYDCLKTYAFNDEDTNSVIELLSFICESYVNLDFRTDSHRGGSNNYVLSPVNFNLFNHMAYEQSGNFFVYRMLDPSIPRTNKFSNMVTWSSEKHYGEDVDTWASVDVSNTIDLDGAMGNLTKLINYNNDIYAFQSIGFAQLLFNSRVQIPASDGVPIEITNGMKMDGKKYISTKVGCTNKWSIIETPLGLYFIDDVLRTTYLFNGQLQDISTTKGMKSWMNDTCNNSVWNPQDFNNCKAFYDKVGKDVYWVYDETALVYSEIIGQYMSFMDYGSVPLIENAGSSTFAAMTVHNAQQDMQLKLLIQGEIHSNGYFIFTSTNNSTIRLTVTFYNSMYQEPAVVSIGTFNDVPDITVEMYTAYLVDNVITYYTFQQIITAVNALLPSYLRLTADSDIELTDHFIESGPQYVDEGPIYLQPTTGIVSPFWELGTGEYNMFFGKFKPYYLTFISNSYPTENKIFNNLAWRDIVKDNTTDKPFVTFDHIEVWNEHQNTGKVRFSNSLKELIGKQPVSYNAAQSNLRKKFNVWRCQIPRDTLATNSGRARISNPWTYIKLSREDINTYRHEFTDLEVDFFI